MQSQIALILLLCTWSIQGIKVEMYLNNEGKNYSMDFGSNLPTFPCVTILDMKTYGVEEIASDTCLVTYKGTNCDNFFGNMPPNEVYSMDEVTSFRACEDRRSKKLPFTLKNAKNKNVVKFDDLCGCQNVAESVETQPTVPQLNYGCFALYPEENCGGEGLQYDSYLAYNYVANPGMIIKELKSSVKSVSACGLECIKLHSEIYKFTLDFDIDESQYLRDVSLAERTTINNNGSTRISRTFQETTTIRQSYSVTMSNSLSAMESVTIDKDVRTDISRNKDRRKDKAGEEKDEEGSQNGFQIDERDKHGLSVQKGKDSRKENSIQLMQGSDRRFGKEVSFTSGNAIGTTVTNEKSSSTNILNSNTNEIAKTIQKGNEQSYNVGEQTSSTGEKIISSSVGREKAFQKGYSKVYNSGGDESHTVGEQDSKSHSTDETLQNGSTVTDTDTKEQSTQTGKSSTSGLAWDESSSKGGSASASKGSSSTKTEATSKSSSSGAQFGGEYELSASGGVNILVAQGSLSSRLKLHASASFSTSGTRSDSNSETEDQSVSMSKSNLSSKSKSGSTSDTTSSSEIKLASQAKANSLSESTSSSNSTSNTKASSDLKTTSNNYSNSTGTSGSDTSSDSILKTASSSKSGTATKSHSIAGSTSYTDTNHESTSNTYSTSVTKSEAESSSKTSSASQSNTSSISESGSATESLTKSGATSHLNSTMETINFSNARSNSLSGSNSKSKSRSKSYLDSISDSLSNSISNALKNGYSQTFNEEHSHSKAYEHLEEKQFLASQTIEFQPCTVSQVSSSLSRLENIPIYYWVYTKITAKRGPHQVLAEDLIEYVDANEMEFVEIWDDYTAIFRTKQIVTANLGVDLKITSETERIPSCEAYHMQDICRCDKNQGGFSNEEKAFVLVNFDKYRYLTENGRQSSTSV